MKERQAGITTQQLKTAPQNAVYVWVSSYYNYVVDLANYLGRNDLMFVSPGWLELQAWRGHAYSAIVVDHAASLTLRQYSSLELLRHTIAVRRNMNKE